MTYENFLIRVKELAPGCKPEAVPWWRDFAVECVDSEQFVRFKQTANKTEAVEKWLDVIYSGLKAVRKECGLETAAALVNLGLERCCLYPGEMMQAAWKRGKTAGRFLKKLNPGRSTVPTCSRRFPGETPRADGPSGNVWPL